MRHEIKLYIHLLLIDQLRYSPVIRSKIFFCHTHDVLGCDPLDYFDMIRYILITAGYGLKIRQQIRQSKVGTGLILSFSISS
jgi:hypothetical protein